MGEYFPAEPKTPETSFVQRKNSTTLPTFLLGKAYETWVKYEQYLYGNFFVSKKAIW